MQASPLKFGSIICLSPEVNERLETARSAASANEKNRAGAEFLQGQYGTIVPHNLLANTRDPGCYVFTDKTETEITIDGQKIARTYITNDILGDHESQFDKWLRDIYGMDFAKKGNRDIVREELQPFLEAQLQGTEFNKPGGAFFYLA